MIRLTWVQPEDLVGHELRACREEGRDPAAVADVAARWSAAGGDDAPPAAGASDRPASPELRTLAGALLDELAMLHRDTAPDEPDELAYIRAACPDWPAARPVTPSYERIHGAWLGRAAGCLLGKPVEKIPRAGIREIAEATGNWPLRTWFTAAGLPAELAERWPWNRRSAPTSLAENIDGMPEDDDLNYPLLALELVERHGTGFGTDDVAKLWLDLLPAGRTFTAERVAYRNLLAGLEPPLTATHRNPFREWIGAQIRTDVYGWVCAGDPGRAAELAYADARLSHTGNGIYGAMFVAAACAVAAAGGDVAEALAAGLAVVPPRSRLAGAVAFGIDRAAAEPDFERVLDDIAAAYGDLHWVHAVNNAAVVAAALTHGGDFAASITAAVAAGWDTDSDGATVGSIAGAIRGAAGIPPEWTDPLRNRLASTVPGFDGIGFDTLARRTMAAAHRGVPETAAGAGPAGDASATAPATGAGRPGSSDVGVVGRRDDMPDASDVRGAGTGPVDPAGERPARLGGGLAGTRPRPVIAVLGSVNMDLVAYVPTAPRRGETVTGREFRTVPGGKGANQAIAAARAGASVRFLGAVGDDAFAPRLVDTLRGAGCDIDRLRAVPGPSGIAHIVVDGDGGNSIVVVPGANGTVTELSDADTAALAGSAALLLQLELPMAGVLAGARAARAAGVPVVLTPAPAVPLPDELLDAVDLLVPNQYEAAALAGVDDPEAAGRVLLERVPEVVVTLGGDGCLYLARGADPIRVPAPNVSTVDTTAAGDTFLGSLAVARAEDRAMPDALRFAAAAGALSVQRPGASSSMPRRAEIDALVGGSA